MSFHLGEKRIATIGGSMGKIASETRLLWQKVRMEHLLSLSRCLIWDRILCSLPCLVIVKLSFISSSREDKKGGSTFETELKLTVCVISSGTSGPCHLYRKRRQCSSIRNHYLVNFYTVNQVWKNISNEAGCDGACLQLQLLGNWDRKILSLIYSESSRLA